MQMLDLHTVCVLDVRAETTSSQWFVSSVISRCPRINVGLVFENVESLSVTTAEPYEHIDTCKYYVLHSHANLT